MAFGGSWPLTKREQGFYGDVAQLFISGVTERHNCFDALRCLRADRLGYFTRVRRNLKTQRRTCEATSCLGNETLGVKKKEQ